MLLKGLFSLDSHNCSQTAPTSPYPRTCINSLLPQEVIHPATKLPKATAPAEKHENCEKRSELRKRNVLPEEIRAEVKPSSSWTGTDTSKQGPERWARVPARRGLPRHQHQDQTRTSTQTHGAHPAHVLRGLLDMEQASLRAPLQRCISVSKTRSLPSLLLLPHGALAADTPEHAGVKHRKTKEDIRYCFPTAGAAQR